MLYVKGINPGPTMFLNSPELIYAIFMVFFLANLLMLPLGWATIKAARTILRHPEPSADADDLALLHRRVVLDQQFRRSASILMLIFGVLGFVMEENDIPLAPAILGLVLGPMLEKNFITSMIKSDGGLLGFFERPIAAGLGIVAIAVWCVPILLYGWRTLRQSRA